MAEGFGRFRVTCVFQLIPDFNESRSHCPRDLCSSLSTEPNGVHSPSLLITYWSCANPVHSIRVPKIALNCRNHFPFSSLLLEPELSAVLRTDVFSSPFLFRWPIILIDYSYSYHWIANAVSKLVPRTTWRNGGID